MSEATTLDAILAGRVTLRQPAKGHRAGTDAVLLAAGVGGDFVGRVTDLGAGVGAAGLAVAARAPGATVSLVEIDRVVADLARENIALNGMMGRVDVIEADATLAGRARAAAGLADRSADLILTNPPFHVEGRLRASPSAYRAKAHAGAADLLAAWLRTAAALLANRGVLVMIHRADALDRLFEAMAGRFGDLRVLPVLPQAGEPATRVVIRAIRGSRAPLTLLAPVALHGREGFTPLAAALHRGEATLDWRL